MTDKPHAAVDIAHVNTFTWAVMSVQPSCTYVLRCAGLQEKVAGRVGNSAFHFFWFCASMGVRNETCFVCFFDMHSMVTVSIMFTGSCAPLQVSVRGRNGSMPCVGETVTYTCSVNAIVHAWKIPSLQLSISITRSTPTFSDGQFYIEITSDGGGNNPITTALTVTAFTALDGANLTCENGLANPGEGEIQMTVVTVLGELE